MYEALEHWKQYKQEQNKQEQIKKAKKEADSKEFDEWFAKLIAKNGTTDY